MNDTELSIPPSAPAPPVRQPVGHTRQADMWLYRTSGDAEHPIVLYDYKPNRKIENAEEFLGGFHGYLHADGYPGYHKLPERITVVGCLAHARRKFADALKVLPMEQRRGSSAAERAQLLGIRRGAAVL